MGPFPAPMTPRAAPGSQPPATNGDQMMLDAMLLCLLCFPGIAVPDNPQGGDQFFFSAQVPAQPVGPRSGRARQQTGAQQAVTDTNCDELAVVLGAAGMPPQPWEEPVRKAGNACRLFSPGPAQRPQ
jgi:hypothetical protein